MPIERLAHYSFLRPEDLPDLRNPLTGRSMNYGSNPWRCDDRFQDWLKSAMHFDSLFLGFHQLRVLWDCRTSNVGEEPKEDYYRLLPSEVTYYVERKKEGMLRDHYSDRYKWDSLDLFRVLQEDSLKIRVYRRQKTLEVEAKEGVVEDLIANNVMAQVAFKKKQKSKSE